jgi:hypothetical protein
VSFKSFDVSAERDKLNYAKKTQPSVENISHGEQD